jgi:hypothetical protein
MKLFEIADKQLGKLKRGTPEYNTVELYKQKIAIECAPYLQLVNGTELYRGMENVGPFKLMHTHAVRLPYSTRTLVNEVINDIYAKVTGKRIREDHALFVISSSYFTQEYGDSYVVFPIGKVNYTFLEGVNDLTLELAGEIEDSGNYDDDKGDFDESVYENKQLLHQIIEPMMLPYIRHNRDIHKAIKGKDEIVFTTESYYVIEEDMWDKVKHYCTGQQHEVI